MSILKYFKLAKPADDHLPDPEGTLSSKLPSSAIASANSEVRSVIDIDCHPPFSNKCMYTHCLAPRRLMRLLTAKITIDRVEKFAKLSSAKLISLLIHQTLILQTFIVYGIYFFVTHCHLYYVFKGYYNLYL